MASKAKCLKTRLKLFNSSTFLEADLCVEQLLCIRMITSVNRQQKLELPEMWACGHACGELS